MRQRLTHLRLVIKSTICRLNTLDTGRLLKRLPTRFKVVSTAQAAVLAGQLLNLHLVPLHLEHQVGHVTDRKDDQGDDKDETEHGEEEYCLRLR